MRLILASSSPRRKEILSQVGLNFEIISSNYEEKASNMEPAEMVKHFAYMKAMDVYHRLRMDTLNNAKISSLQETYIIGADTIVYCDEIMGKPKDREDAVRMLRTLSGRGHHVMTGLCIINAENGECITEYEKTRVLFKSLTETEIEKYIESGEPFDKAGSYAIQGIGSLFVKGIEGCYFNVVGFPIFLFSLMMDRMGYKLI